MHDVDYFVQASMCPHLFLFLLESSLHGSSRITQNLLQLARHLHCWLLHYRGGDIKESVAIIHVQGNRRCTMKFLIFSFKKMLSLTHWGRMTHICGSKLTIIGSDNGLSPGRRQAIILTKCWNIANWTPRNKLQRNLNQNLYIFIQENAFENVIWKLAAILS